VEQNDVFLSQKSSPNEGNNNVIYDNDLGDSKDIYPIYLDHSATISLYLINSFEKILKKNQKNQKNQKDQKNQKKISKRFLLQNLTKNSLNFDDKIDDLNIQNFVFLLQILLLPDYYSENDHIDPINASDIPVKPVFGEKTTPNIIENKSENSEAEKFEQDAKEKLDVPGLTPAQKNHHKFTMWLNNDVKRDKNDTNRIGDGEYVSYNVSDEGYDDDDDDDDGDDGDDGGDTDDDDLYRKNIKHDEENNDEKGEKSKNEGKIEARKNGTFFEPVFSNEAKAVQNGGKSPGNKNSTGYGGNGFKSKKKLKKKSEKSDKKIDKKSATKLVKKDTTKTPDAQIVTMTIPRDLVVYVPVSAEENSENDENDENDENNENNENNENFKTEVIPHPYPVPVPISSDYSDTLSQYLPNIPERLMDSPIVLKLCEIFPKNVENIISNLDLILNQISAQINQNFIAKNDTNESFSKKTISSSCQTFDNDDEIDNTVNLIVDDIIMKELMTLKVNMIVYFFDEKNDKNEKNEKMLSKIIQIPLSFSYNLLLDSNLTSFAGSITNLLCASHSTILHQIFFAQFLDFFVPILIDFVLNLYNLLKKNHFFDHLRNFSFKNGDIVNPVGDIVANGGILGGKGDGQNDEQNDEKSDEKKLIPLQLIMSIRYWIEYFIIYDLIDYQNVNYDDILLFEMPDELR
jgi:hypothetical protein